jgi:hypothetical protein
MGVRPPDNDNLDEPDIPEFGIVALDDRLESTDVSFPAEVDELRHQLGSAEIDFDAAGHSVQFSEVLDRVPQTRFESKDELLDATHPVFEDLRSSASVGLLSQLRALVPF